MRKNKSWIGQFWPAILAVVILLIGIGAYWKQFGSNALSDKPADWGVLGDYMNMAFAAANFIVFLWFSLLVQRYNEAKDEKEEKLTTPLIAISVSESIYKERRFYELINVGHGAAINILSSRVDANVPDKKDPVWRIPVMCNSLLPNTFKHMRWTHNTWAILLLYTDSLNRQKVSLCLNDQNHTVEYNDSLPDEKLAIVFKEISLTGKQLRAIFQKQAKRYVEADPPVNHDDQDW